MGITFSEHLFERIPHKHGKQKSTIEDVRTAIGKYTKSLSMIRPDDLGAAALKAVVEKSGTPALAVLQDLGIDPENARLNPIQKYLKF